jgi:hypothetical protein
MAKHVLVTHQRCSNSILGMEVAAVVCAASGAKPVGQPVVAGKPRFPTRYLRAGVVDVSRRSVPVEDMGAAPGAGRSLCLTGGLRSAATKAATEVLHGTTASTAGPLSILAFSWHSARERLRLGRGQAEQRLAG